MDRKFFRGSPVIRLFTVIRYFDFNGPMNLTVHRRKRRHLSFHSNRAAIRHDSLALTMRFKSACVEQTSIAPNGRQIGVDLETDRPSAVTKHRHAILTQVLYEGRDRQHIGGERRALQRTTADGR